MMAEAISLYGGKITTIELDEKVAEQAKKNFERAGVKDQIQVKIGDARTIITDMNEEFDLIFQDVGDKTLYDAMFDDYVRLLKPGGILLAEDALFPVFDFHFEYSYLADMRGSLDAFNKRVANCLSFESTLLPIGDGLMVAVKK